MSMNGGEQERASSDGAGALESMVVPSAYVYASTLIEDLTRDGLRLVLEVLLDHEAEAYVASFEHCRDERGRALVSRNGVARPRTVPLGRAAIAVRAPRVNDRRVLDGRRQRYTSAILPPGKPPTLGGAHKLAQDLLRGWGNGDFSAARKHLAARGIAGGEEVEAVLFERWCRWKTRPMADLRFERLTAHVFDHTPLSILETDVLLVISGVLPSGRTELIDLRNGDPRSDAAWADLLVAQRARGLADEITLVDDGDEETMRAFAMAAARTAR